jgi:hypothetical protein
MIEFLKRTFTENWTRKLIALVLSIAIWFLVDNTLTQVKTFSNINVRIVNVPKGRTIEGMDSEGVMNKKISLTLTGNKTTLDRLTSNDLQVVIDASQKTKNEWVATIDRDSLISLNPEINIQKEISKVSVKNYIVKTAPLATVKIPVFITQPIGEAPKGYRFLDVWPYQLYTTVSGPEESVEKLKTRGVKLTFNLNDISKAQLDNLSTGKKNDVVSFLVPDDWKKIYIPSLSDKHLTIDDPDAKYLQIDFVRSETIPIPSYIGLSIFLPANAIDAVNLSQIKFAGDGIVKRKSGLPALSMPLFAKGVNEIFIQIVKDMLEIVVIYPPKPDGKMDWSVQFINAKELEDRYVSLILSDASDEEIKQMQPELRQKYLRNRFRNYMNRFQLFSADDKLLELSFELKGNQINVSTK